MYLMLGDLIDKLEALRREHDSATTVAIETGLGIFDIKEVTYDRDLDRVYISVVE